MPILLSIPRFLQPATAIQFIPEQFHWDPIDGDRVNIPEAWKYPQYGNGPESGSNRLAATPRELNPAQNWIKSSGKKKIQKISKIWRECGIEIGIGARDTTANTKQKYLPAKAK